MTRCFIAVKFGEEIEAKLQQLQNRVKQLDIDASFPRDLHCTLAFLGELYEDQIDKTKEKLSSLSLKPSEVSVKGVGFFPNENFIRVFWVGLEGLDEIQKKIAKALNHKEKFSGHVTIARIKSPKNREQLQELAEACKGKEFGKTAVSEIILFKSVLTPQGPHYEELLVKKFS